MIATAAGLAMFGIVGLLILRVGLLMRDGRRAMKAQASQMPSDYVFKPNPDDIIHTSEGTFRVSSGEYVPFEKAA